MKFESNFLTHNNVDFMLTFDLLMLMRIHDQMNLTTMKIGGKNLEYNNPVGFQLDVKGSACFDTYGKISSFECPRDKLWIALNASNTSPSNIGFATFQ